MNKLRLLLAVLVGVVLAVGVSFGVQAEASNSNTTYYACLSNGRLSQVGGIPPKCGAHAVQISFGASGANGTNVLTTPGTPYGSCNSGDTDIALNTDEVWSCLAGNWTDTDSNIKGATGAEGPAGPTGPTGPTGPSGTSTGYSGSGSAQTTGASSVQVTALPVGGGADGNYVVNASIDFQNTNTNTANPLCGLEDNQGTGMAFIDEETLTVPGNDYSGNLTMTDTANSNEFYVYCAVPDSVQLNVSAHITATQVDTIN